MKLSARFLLSAFATLITLCAQAQNAENWKLKSDKNGVKVYYRSTGDVHEIKLTYRMKARMSNLMHVLNEVDNYPTWGYKVTESHLVKKVSDNEMYYYTLIDFPWPLSDRDMVMHSVMTQDPTTRVVHSKSKAVRGMVPHKKGVVRITEASTNWRIAPAGAGFVDIEYQLYSHPGGNLPDWAVNMALDYGPKESLKNIENMLKDPKYAKLRVAHIVD
ncbi:MAG: START domain-containing protein [Saprospiraceae bacterium]